MRSADAMRSIRVIAAERGMIVGARDARFVLNRVGVRPDNERPDRENGVVDRGGSYPSTAVGGDAEATRGSGPGEIACGLVDWRSPLTFSSVAARLRFS
jgi:hypothetical protein